MSILDMAIERRHRVDGAKLILALKKKFNARTDRILAAKLGVHQVSIQNWRRSEISERRIAGLIESAIKTATKDFQKIAIRPLVEFYRIQRCESKRGAKYELFSLEDQHPYRAGLKKELEDKHGVYVFFDSRGRAIYTGKAKGQSLWREMTSAFNRDRGSVQKIKRVRHPENRVDYKTSEEKSRQIVEYAVPLHDLAAYFSAYEVVDGMIDELESLMVRSFANDLLNIRMERFGKRTKSKP